MKPRRYLTGGWYISYIHKGKCFGRVQDGIRSGLHLDMCVWQITQKRQAYSWRLILRLLSMTFSTMLLPWSLGCCRRLQVAWNRWQGKVASSTPLKRYSGCLLRKVRRTMGCVKELTELVKLSSLDSRVTFGKTVEKERRGGLAPMSLWTPVFFDAKNMVRRSLAKVR